jgi:pimeloyl-ACP methyl ester carboxylesterase
VPQVTSNGLKIEYESFGPKSAPPIVLIMGLGAQLILWPLELVHGLVDRGFRVIRFDNRDIGLSEKVDAPVPNLALNMFGSRLGFAVKAPYTLHDMAHDTVGLLDALEIQNAHIVGASMGGMIAQVIAAAHPERTLSLTSIMSTTGEPRVSMPSLGIVKKVFFSRPKRAGRGDVIDYYIALYQAIGSPGFDRDEVLMREMITGVVERSYHPAGVARQTAAILATGDRSPMLRHITAPTLVIHGDADPLVPLAGGIDTAKKIAGSRMEIIPGMGHDLPQQLIPRFVELIGDHAEAATGVRV